MSFNVEQLDAIHASSQENVLISAGAGSGKTSTLSERVYRLIESGEVSPSELLVLTFTNNAAHEMKDRIIARFKADGSRYADQMPSAHVQTFDSFSQYLVSTYAGRLGLSNRIVVANESLMESKKAEILDAVLDSYYGDPENKKRLIALLTKIATGDDRGLKRIILSVDKELQKMLPSSRKAFAERYDESFLSREAFERFLDEYVGIAKKRIIDALREAYFLECHYEQMQDETFDIQDLQAFFRDKTFFLRDYRDFHFDEQNLCAPLYQAILELLDLGGEEFIRRVKKFPEFYADILANPTKKNVDSPDLVAKAKVVLKPMRALFLTKEATLREVTSLSGEEERDYALMASFNEDVHLILELVEKMEDALFEYKKSINAFTFADIGTLALRLVTEPEFEDVAKALRNRFTYIMVDEYQDTNDFQEAFIDALLTPNVSGKRAHLFCVGDAKQSIYAFRNSNVELFRARQREYEASALDRVIHMNRNYRTGKPLLLQVNAIFSRYMTLDHGSVDYSDPKEQLRYDDKVNLYGAPYDYFGIYRILPDTGTVPDGMNPKLWEAKAIVQTIQDMVASGHLVYDKKAGIHPCTYKDFAVLTRMKSGFSLYQSLFNEAGIPLNISVATNLREIDAVILLQSLLGLLSWICIGESVDVKHLFASVARSYAFQYDDETIHDLITYAGEDELALIKDDPIMKSLQTFASEHEGASFNTIFLDLLSSFHVIDRLYLLGGVDENIAKIESLHAMVLSEEKAGEGLKEFVAWFRNIRKYALDLTADSDFESEDSVDLMTIHASKGLERKIVFMPASLNVLGKGDGRSKPDFDFSREYGLLLPNYILPPGEENGTCYSLPYQVFRQKSREAHAEEDEHVRIFYVALTRAENSIYIVGDDPKKAGSLYEMLDAMPHYEAFNPTLLRKMVDSGVVDAELLARYQALTDFTQNRPLPLTKEDLGEEAYGNYVVLGETYYVSQAEKWLKETIDKIRLSIYLHYASLAQGNHRGDLDFYARLYAAKHFPSAGIRDLAGFRQYVASLYQAGKEKEEMTVPTLLLADVTPSADGGEESDGPRNITNEAVDEIVRKFGEAALNEAYTLFGHKEIKPKRKDEDLAEKIHLVMAEELLSAYALVFDGYPYVSRVSYASEEYPDTVMTCHLDESRENHGAATPNIHVLAPSQINDEEIAFPVREHKRASKQIPYDDDTPVREKFDYGVTLHRLMELVDFKTKDVSFIKDEKKRKLVHDILALPLFNRGEDAVFLPEYGYFDEDLQTMGFIDLLIVENGEYVIADYKTKNIEDEAYVDQLHTYQRNVSRIFGVDKAHIRLFLVSLLDRRYVEITD